MSKYESHPTAIIDKDCKIGDGTKIWHYSHLMSGCTVGDNCTIGQNVVISPGVIIGAGTKIQNNVSVYTGVICEENVFLGPSCVFTNVINPRSVIERKHEFRRTIIRRGASIGANATIICGHTVGEYAMIGAGTVVTKDILPYALVIGNPSKQIGWVSQYGCKLNFDKDGKATCPESGEVYRLRDGQVMRIS